MHVAQIVLVTLSGKILGDMVVASQFGAMVFFLPVFGHLGAIFLISGITDWVNGLFLFHKG